MEGFSGNEPYAHLSISIGDPKGYYDSFSFGVIWSSFGSAPQAAVYEDTTPGGRIVAYLKTTHSQDVLARKHIYRTWRKDSEAYYGPETCVSYSERKFDEISKLLGVAPTYGHAWAGTPRPPTSVFAAIHQMFWAALVGPPDPLSVP